MANFVDFSGRPFHFIGIGGIGMSAIAYVLAKRQLPVSGSDVHLNHITQKLSDEGVHIFHQQDASNLDFFRSIATQPANPLSTAACVSSPSSSSQAYPSLAQLHATVSPPPPPVLTHESMPSHVEIMPLSPTASPASEQHAAGTNGSEAHGNGTDLKNIGRREGSNGTGAETRPSAASLPPQVVCSTAISPSNAEYRAALELGCPIFHRSDLLAALMADSTSIAVAGTHGKTTTSSMIGHLLLNAGLDPTILVGGEVDAWGGNARLGKSEYLVAEADESDGSLVKFSPSIGIVTNIELDHPDHYSSLEAVVAIFQTFTQQCQVVIANLDCLTIRQHLQPDLSYALSHQVGADYTVENVIYGGTFTQADVIERGQRLGQVRLSLLGEHNLSNALAAIALGRHLGLEFEAIATSLPTFQGARRRFEQRGHYCDITFVDDYAHHPSELRATLTAARLHATLPNGHQRRVVAVFQPHRYSRTLAFLDEFGQAFRDADLVITTEIYSAGEANPHHITGHYLAEAIAHHHPQSVYQPSLQDVAQFLQTHLKPGDLVLFLGAGNLNTVIPDLLRVYQQRDGDRASSALEPSASPLENGVSTPS